MYVCKGRPNYGNIDRLFFSKLDIDTCLDVLLEIKMSSPREKRARCEGETSPSKSSMETDEHRECRLKKRREAYRRRKERETGEQRQQRLLRRRQQRANETQTQRDKRLTSIRTSAQQQRATETPDQREVRLSYKRTSAQQQRANETPDQREARLNARRLSSAQQLSDPVTTFHSNITDLVTQRSMCQTCHELMYDSRSVQCARCHRDSNTIPSFSDGNNMNPGAIPHQLQVHNATIYTRGCGTIGNYISSMYYYFYRVYRKWKKF